MKKQLFTVLSSLLIAISLSITANGEDSDTLPEDPFAEARELGKPYGVADPIFNNKIFGAELGENLHPADSTIKRLFKNFSNVEAVSMTTTPPQNRRERLGYKDDWAHQRGLQIMINRGHITPGTLILSNSGHDIPLAAHLLKNPEMRAQAVFHLPEPLSKDPGTDVRLLAQAQDWSEDIAFYQRRNAELGAPLVLFIALEGHRKDYDGKYLYKIPWEKFPNKKDLIKLGINNVIYMTEAHPNNPSVKEKVFADMAPYIKSLGLPTSYIGVDCRRDEGC